MIHIAGVHMQVGPLLRQRCSWCGASLLEYDRSRLGIPDQLLKIATLPVGAWVNVDGDLSTVVPHTAGDPLPAEACARVPDAADESKAYPRAEPEETQDHPPFDGGNAGGNGL